MTDSLMMREMNLYTLVTFLPSIAKFRARVGKGEVLNDFDSLYDAIAALKKYFGRTDKRKRKQLRTRNKLRPISPSQVLQ